MPRAWLALILLVVGIWWSLHRTHAVPVRSLPDGFTAAAAGSGHLLTASFSEFSGATDASRGAIRALAAYFDAPPRVRAAVSDSNDSQAQVFFDAHIASTPVAGVILVSMNGGTSTVSVLYDRPQSLRDSLAQMARSGPAEPRILVERPVNWQAYNFPDGSGSINLPEGWVSDGGEQGEVQAHGSHGEYLQFGRPNYIQEYALPGSGSIMIMPYISDPVEALVAFERQQGMELRILDSQHDQAPNLSLALYDYTANGVPCRAFAYLQTMLTPGGGSWILYTSYVAAPVDGFAGSFQTLLDIWKTYRISGKLIGERIQAAAQSMREAGEILRQSNANTSETYRRTNYAWELCRREQDLIEDTWDHERGTVDTIDAHHLVDELNRQEGSERWRVVPMSEY